MSFTVTPLVAVSGSYATSGDYADYTGQTAPTDIDRLLQRASELLNDYTRTARYEVDDDGMPIEADDIAAFRDAACAQVEFWVASNEEDDILGPVDVLAMAGVTAKGRELAPRAARALIADGLYSVDPVTL